MHSTQHGCHLTFPNALFISISTTTMTQLPTYGNWGARIEDPKDSLNPHLGEVQNWSIWHEDNDIWKLVAKEDISYFRNRDDKEICRHLDACGGISAQKADEGMVVFRLPKMEVVSLYTLNV